MDLRIRRIHLLSLMMQLQELYDKGLDFIDVSGAIAEGQDVIRVTYNKSYMNEELEDNFDRMVDEQLPATLHVKLSKDDLDQLI